MPPLLLDQLKREMNKIKARERYSEKKKVAQARDVLIKVANLDVTELLDASSSENQQSDQNIANGSEKGDATLEVAPVKSARSDVDPFKRLELKLEDDEQSELSAFSGDDVSSIYASSVCDDEYYIIPMKKYGRRVPELPSFTDCYFEIWKMFDYLKIFWQYVTDLNETRKKIIKDINQKTCKPRSFSIYDVTRLNGLLTLIETDINSMAPAMTKFKATFVQDSSKKVVLFQGYKYAKVPWRPSLFCCTYDIDYKNDPAFGSNYKCNGHIYLDEKGFLQPGSFAKHCHGPIEEGINDPTFDLPSPSRATLRRITSNGNVQGKDIKLYQFLIAKLQETSEYRRKAQLVKESTQIVVDELEKLRTYVPTEFEKSDKMNLLSSIKWVEFILLHIKVDNVQ